MYHEEKLINGTLCWRGTPDEEFKPYTAEQLTQKIIKAREATRSVGAEAPGEDDLIAEGINFGDWEKGFSAAIEIIERRMTA